jgi:hypothetical protein
MGPRAGQLSSIWPTLIAAGLGIIALLRDLFRPLSRLESERGSWHVGRLVRIQYIVAHGIATPD